MPLLVDHELKINFPLFQTFFKLSFQLVMLNAEREREIQRGEKERDREIQKRVKKVFTIITILATSSALLRKFDLSFPKL